MSPLPRLRQGRAALAIALGSWVASTPASADASAHVLSPDDARALVEILRVDVPGCALDGVSVEIDHARARYACGAARYEAHLRHPDEREAGDVATERFALGWANGAPEGLRARVEALVRARESAFAWSEPAKTTELAVVTVAPTHPGAGQLALRAAPRRALVACVVVGALVGAWLAARERRRVR